MLKILNQRSFSAYRIVSSKAARLVRWRHPRQNDSPARPERRDAPGPIEPLHLKPGEKVRVKPYEDIAATLDEQNKLQGLAFTPAQRRYCGGSFTVLNRLENVFDERRWRMFRIRDTVLLEDVFCDGNGGMEKEWNGCDRHCLLWWKEAWLERLDG